MNEERMGLILLSKTEYIRDHFGHIYSVAVNQVMVATVELRSDDLNLTNMFLESMTFLYQGNHDWNYTIWNIILTEI